MTEGSQLRGNDIEAGILWQPNDAFGQVIGAERGGRVRGLGFGPTPSGNCARSMDDSTPPPTSTATDQRVIELSTQVEAMKEKCTRYDALEAQVQLMQRMLTRLCPSFPMDKSKITKINGGGFSSSTASGRIIGGGPGINNWTGRPYSQRYYEILVKQRDLLVWHQKEEFLQVFKSNQTVILVGEIGSDSPVRIGSDRYKNNSK
nr:putative pre-mrna-splicing factor atp-dependent rna helicase deah2 [Quercus suber]